MSVTGYEHPWTPGPWRLTDKPESWQRKRQMTYNIYAPVSVAYDGDPEDDLLLSDSHYYPVAPEKMADAKLIALAPEMAEAILALDKNGYKMEWQVENMAAKLRAIGVEDE
jgi:hypothetical protein